MALELTDQNFDQEVLQASGAVLVDFWAPWCGPCKMMGPIIDELAKKMEGKAKVGKLNVEEHGATAQKYNIMSIPSLKIFKGGKIAAEFVGVQSPEVLERELLKLA
jgi:thioredoxin 1